jgi:hypothetical protein
MDNDTKEFIEKHYLKIYLLAALILFAVIIYLGISGFLGTS